MTKLGRRTVVSGMLLLAGLGAVACGDEEKGVPISEVPGRLAEIDCAKFAECTAPFGDQGDCVTSRTREQEDSLLPGWQAAIDAGQLGFNGDRFELCEQALVERDCSMVLDRLPAGCGLAFEGRVVLGGMCHFDVECQRSAYCNLSGGCPGVCQARLDAGSPCDRSGACAPGLVCEVTGSGGLSTCRAPLRAGESCTTNDQCAFGLVCAEVSDGSRCRAVADAPVANEGEDCTLGEGALCADGLFCAEGDGGDRSCVAGAPSLGPCMNALPEMCPEGEFCRVAAGAFEGTCTSLPQDGQACAVDSTGVAQRCADEHVCADGQCVKLRRIGEPCTRDLACYSSTCSEGTCAAPECQL